MEENKMNEGGELVQKQKIQHNDTYTSVQI